MRRRQFLALFALGVIGVLSLLPAAIPAIARMPLPAGAPPRPVIVLLSLLQPTVLLAIAVAVGLRFASRLGLRSHIVEAAGTGAPVWPVLRRDAPLAIGVGAAAMVVVVLLDIAFRPLMGDAWRRLEQTQTALPDPDYIRPSVLVREAGVAGLAPLDRVGGWASYTQRFSVVSPPRSPRAIFAPHSPART